MLDPISVASCSKAPRGLSVLLRVTCIFTGTSVSPSTWPRQRPSRYAIRAGRNLPDKEFRLSLTRTRSSSGCASSCASLHVAMQMGPYHPSCKTAWRMVSEDSAHVEQSFLLIVRTRRIVTVDTSTVARDSRSSQHIAEFYNYLG